VKKTQSLNFFCLKYFLIILIVHLIAQLCGLSWAQEMGPIPEKKISSLNFKNLKEMALHFWPAIQDNQISSLKESHEIIVESKAESLDDGKNQTFTMRALGLHPQKCHKVLKKLSRFEDYHQWLDFLSDISYYEKQDRLTFKANHLLLPFPMTVTIITKRPTTVGEYPFYFPNGIFTGLKGAVQIYQLPEGCALFAQSFWSGKHTQINNFVIEVFTSTLTKIGAKILIRKTLL
jgi:hypothetical protein